MPEKLGQLGVDFSGPQKHAIFMHAQLMHTHASVVTWYLALVEQHMSFPASLQPGHSIHPVSSGTPLKKLGQLGVPPVGTQGWPLHPGSTHTISAGCDCAFDTGASQEHYKKMLVNFSRIWTPCGMRHAQKGGDGVHTGSAPFAYHV